MRNFGITKWGRRALSIALVAAFSVVVPLQPTSANAATVPTIDCQSDPAQLSTGHDPATGGILADNSNDLVWEVSNEQPATADYTSVPAPPATVTWNPTQVLRAAGAAWVASSFADANWITPIPSNSSRGDWYYRLRFNIDSEVGVSNFTLPLSFNADNALAEVWVNGVAQSGVAGSGIPQFATTVNWYNAQGYLGGNSAQANLSEGWQNGLNEVIVLVKDDGGYAGFMAQARPTGFTCSAIALTKTPGSVEDVDHNGPDPGDTIHYSFTVTNKGTDALSSIVVTDTRLGANSVTCLATTLAVNASTTCESTVDLTLTQSDFDSGSAVNTATVTGVSATGGEVSDTATATSTLTQSTGLSLVKTSARTDSSPVFAGDTVPFNFLVTNTGNVTVSSITIVDDLAISDLDCPQTSLAAGASVTCTANYTLTAADVAAGTVTNWARATGEDPNSTEVSSVKDDAVVDLEAAAPVLDLTKTAVAPDGPVFVGDEIEYTFTATNTGNVTLTGLAITDPLISDVVCAETELAANGGQTTCTGTYALQASDLAAGSVTNTATASALTRTNATVESDEASWTVPVTPAAPLIEVAKSVAEPGPVFVGDDLAYSFLVTNTGNVGLSAVGVVDPLIADVDCPQAVLAAGESMTCSGSYSVTADDLAAGKVDNTAKATGTARDGSEVFEEDTVSVSLTAAVAGIGVVKSAEVPSGPVAVGDSVRFKFVVTNSGNTALTGVRVSDPLIADVVCPGSVLAAGESMTCSGSYVVTQADLDAGSVTNHATVKGSPAKGGDVSGDDSVTVPLTESVPGVHLVKSAVVDGPVSVGDSVKFKFVVSNTGNVALSSVAVSDPKIGSVLCPGSSLAVGESMTCSGSYVLVDGDLVAGSVFNTATAVGEPPSGSKVSDDDSIRVPVTRALAGIGLVKSVVEPGPVLVGDKVAYSFVVTNLGNVALSKVRVADLLIADVSCPRASLAVGESMKCSGSYVLTEADLVAGRVVNTAAETGDSVVGEVSDSDSVSVGVTRAVASIGLVKSAKAPSGSVVVGDEVEFSFVVTNTGNVKLSEVVVADPKIADVSCPQASLAVGESMTCKGTYALLAADLAAGQVVNTATASGNPGGAKVSDEDTVAVSVVEAVPSIELVKVANPSGPVVLGDEVVFTFDVTNTGDVQLDSVAVADQMVGEVTCPESSLDPGETETCWAEPYVVTADDVAAGEIVNQAQVTAVGGTQEVSADDEVTVQVNKSDVKDDEDGDDDDSGDDGDDDNLAYTGAAFVGPGIWAGAMLLAAGITFLIIARRRQNT